jgi:hypothetical protein
MTPLARCLGLLLTCLAPSLASAQPEQADTSALEFHGFRPGARLDELQALVTRLDGGRLRCDRARRDPRVSECRAVLQSAEVGGPVNLWVSAVDSTAGVITLSRTVDGELLDRWRRTIERRYGRVDASVQGSQRMMQWVRRGRMIRLTWRVQRGEKMASVSLVDGRVLDQWHGPRTQ